MTIVKVTEIASQPARQIQPVCMGASALETVDMCMHRVSRREDGKLAIRYGGEQGKAKEKWTDKSRFKSLADMTFEWRTDYWRALGNDSQMHSLRSDH